MMAPASTDLALWIVKRCQSKEKTIATIEQFLCHVGILTLYFANG